MLGFKLKQRISIQAPNFSQPCVSTNTTRTRSRVTPCKGSADLKSFILTEDLVPNNLDEAGAVVDKN